MYQNQVYPFRFDLLPTPKPIQPIAVGELVRPYTEAELETFRAEAKALEPERLTQKGELRKHIKPEVVEAWAKLEAPSEIWGSYVKAHMGLDDIAEMLANRKQQITILRECQKRLNWLKPGVECTLVCSKVPDQPMPFIFLHYEITGYRIPGNEIDVSLAFRTQNKKGEWHIDTIGCDWFARDSIYSLLPATNTATRAITA